MPISPLRCGVVPNCVEITQTREVLKSGSIPVRAAKFFIGKNASKEEFA